MIGFGLDRKDKAFLAGTLAAVSVVLVGLVALFAHSASFMFGISYRGVGFFGAMTISAFLAMFMLLFLFVAAGADNVQGEKNFFLMVFAGTFSFFTCAFSVVL